jgi:hypothetical protein
VVSAERERERRERRGGGGREGAGRNKTALSLSASSFFLFSSYLLGLLLLLKLIAAVLLEEHSGLCLKRRVELGSEREEGKQWGVRKKEGRRCGGSGSRAADKFSWPRSCSPRFPPRPFEGLVPNYSHQQSSSRSRT